MKQCTTLRFYAIAEVPLQRPSTIKQSHDDEGGNIEGDCVTVNDAAENDATVIDVLPVTQKVNAQKIVASSSHAR